MKDYKIFIPHDCNMPLVGDLKKGIYDVLLDNESYSNEPTSATISYFGESKEVPISPHSFFDDILACAAYAVTESFDPKFLTSESTEQMMGDLEALRPYDYLVEEYVAEFSTLQSAWQSAVLNDWSHRFLTQEKANRIMSKILSPTF